MNIVIFGPPGAGKGTQAKKIVDRFSFVQISTGDLVRAEIATGSDQGKLIQQIVEKGSFPSDESIIDLFLKALKASGSAVGRIFDGFPRTLNQAKVLNERLEQQKQGIDLVISLDVDLNVLIKRITGRFSCQQCGAIYNHYFQNLKVEGVCDVCGGTTFTTRADDKEETVRKRYENYKTLTAPVLEFLKEKSNLLEIDGDAEPSAIFAIIEEKIKGMQEALQRNA